MLQEKSKQVYQSEAKNDRDDLISRSPFVHHILEAKLPDNWRGLTIDKYDGTSDPGEHLNIFTTQRACTQLVHLTPPSSIDSFATLARRFNLQFATSRPHPLTSLALVNIRQEKGESLRAFMERFGKVTFSIHNLEPAVAMHHLTTALKPGPFVNSIRKKSPVDLDELRSRAAKYMQMEELSEYRNQVRMDQGSNSKNTDRREAFKARQGNERRNELERPPLGPKYPTNWSKVLDQALATEILRMLRRANTSLRADKSKYCRYHQNRGHTTEECTTLKHKIEELIKEGHLKDFVQTNPIGQIKRGRDQYTELPRRSDDKRFERQRSRSREPPARRYDEREKYPKRVINTIAGGFAGEGPIHSARKRHLRQGSSADILYWNTFKQLGIPEEELREYYEPLVGFSGETVETRGCIDLYTSFGSEHEGKQVKVTYLVMHANTSYNILLDRPSLNKLKAIVSTLHLAMKFPSERGRIVTVHADQKTARECYFASLCLKPFHGAAEISTLYPLGWERNWMWNWILEWMRGVGLSPMKISNLSNLDQNRNK
ncbi:uncharacterized protein LOC113847525 [Abrus precatorius]|uniref:Uncharacterized protein LOC113847525 n=1 Tax=Abrus precatorius TaxID=3816 RepID=A0A8B8JLZ7_ABRPR|nr:uncharacterized protein LOC113847525 [Abrus precatorius]